MSTPKIHILAIPVKGKTATIFEFNPTAAPHAQAVRIPAQTGVRYQIKDLAFEGQKAPSLVKVKRVGKHLEITFESGNEGPDLVLENYYDVVTDGSMSLVGEAENGHMYEYAVSNANSNTPLALVTPSQGSVNAVLGSAEFIQSSGAALSEQSLTPLFALLGGVGIAGVSGAVQGKQDNAASAAALKTLQAAAQANNASTSTTSLETYSAAGITGVTQDNLAAINNALNTAAVSGTHVDTAAKVQAIVDAYNRIFAEAKNANSPDPTAADFAAIGVTGIKDGAQTKLLIDALHGKGNAQISSLDELNNLAKAASAVANVTDVATGKENAAVAPSKANLTTLGFTNVTDKNLEAVQNAIAQANAKQPLSSLTEMKKVIDSAVVVSATFAATDAVQAATDAGKAARAATAALAKAQDEVKDPATPEQLKAVTDAQAAATKAAEAAVKAATNAQTAVDAAKAATKAAGETDSQALTDASTAAGNAASAAASGATEAAAAVKSAETATDDEVAKYVDAATKAASALTKASGELSTAQENLDAAKAGMTGDPATATQIQAVEDAQTALNTAASNASAAASAATTAAAAATAAAGAGNEAVPSSVSAIAAQVSAANSAVSAAIAATVSSESATDAQVAKYVSAAEAAAAALTTATGALSTAQENLDAAKAAMTGDPATATQIQAVEDAQTALNTAASNASAAASAATTAAAAATASAGAGNELVPDSVKAIAAQVSAANSAVSAAIAATVASESATDAQVGKYFTAAEAAASALTTATGALSTAQENLDAAKAAMTGDPATATQIQTVEDAQTALNTAAANASAAASAATTTAAAAATAAAGAGNEAVPSSVSAIAAQVSAANSAVSAAIAATVASESATDAQVGKYFTAAEAAASALTTATGALSTAQSNLAAAKAAMTGDPATATQIQAVEDAQTALNTAAANASAAASAATTAAAAATAAAGAGNEAVPSSVSAIAAQVSAANSAVSAAIAATVSSESATDAQVAKYVSAAEAAAAALTTATGALSTAQENLDAAKAAMTGDPATATQIQAVEEAQTALNTAAANASTAAAAATSAAAAATAAAGAGNELVPDSVKAITAQVTDANSAVGTATAASAASESATDAQVAKYVSAAEAAAAALTTATGALSTAQSNLAAAKAAMTDDPATATQIQAVEEAQTALNTAAANASAAASAATTAAAAATAAATAAAGAGNEAVPSSVSTIAAQVSAANSAVSAATAATVSSESATDAQVAKYVSAAAGANIALGTAQTNFNTAQTALASALTAMGDPATTTQLTAVETAKTNLQTASTALATATTTAQTAVSAAQAAATAANETSDFSAVTGAISTANTATSGVTKTMALATIEAAAQGNTATGSSPSVADYAAAGVTVDAARLASMNDALNDADVKASNVSSTTNIQHLVNSYNIIFSAADGTAGNAGSASPTIADYTAIGVTGVDSAAKESLLSNSIDSKSNVDVNTVAKVQALADSVKTVMDVAALTSSTQLNFSTYTTLQTALANLGVSGVNDYNVGAVWVAIRDSDNAGSGVNTLSKLQAMVNAANDTPKLLTSDTNIAVVEDTATIITVSELLAGKFSDPDTGFTLKGFAIDDVQTTNYQGSWSYSKNGGSIWTDFPTGLSASGALFVNAADLIRFVPVANWNGPVNKIGGRVVDNTMPDTVTGNIVSVGYYGRSGGPMSADLWITPVMTAVNDAPVLDTGASITYALPSTPKSGSAPTGQAGMLISNLVGSHITDVDTASSAGIAITHVDTSRGTLWYSLDGGTNWIQIQTSTSLSNNNALLLASDTNNRIYFEPTPSSTDATSISSALKFRAWDKTTGTEGTFADTTVAGSTAFSTAEASVSQAVTPVVIDVNRDGVVSYSQVAMDVDGDGHLDQTAWAGAQDGVLVWDKLGDGKVHDHSQYAFSQYGAAGSTDLQGLAAGFDSNHDGVLDAKDAKFAEFKVWQDANQNGVADAGEMHSLKDVGIASIQLTSDGVRSNPASGVIESGHTTATATDGSSVLVSDAAFAYSALAYSVNGDKLSLLGGDMNLDFSSFVAAHKNVAEVDLSGSGANTLKLTLNDVLATATTNGMHKLTLTGDANDTVVMDMAHWTKTEATVTEGNHTYAVYTDNTIAQLMIDQAMLNAGHVI